MPAPSLAKLAQLAPLTTACCVRQTAQIQHLAAREPHGTLRVSSLLRYL